MKVYFGFTVAGSRSSVEAAKKIVDILQSMGHEVLTSHLLREDAWEADRRMPPQEVFARDLLVKKNGLLRRGSEQISGLKTQAKRRTRDLGDEDVALCEPPHVAERKISLLIVGNTHPNCILVPYSRLDELEELVRSWVSPQKIV